MSESRKNTEKRRKLILEAVKTGKMKSHKDIIKYLKSKGIPGVNSSTISKDIDSKFLKAYKINNTRSVYYNLSAEYIFEEREKKLIEVFKEASDDIRESVFYRPEIIAIKTNSGYSQELSRQLQLMFEEEVIGSIYKDDLLLLIYKNKGEEEHDPVKSFIESMTQNK